VSYCTLYIFLYTFVITDRSCYCS